MKIRRSAGKSLAYLIGVYLGDGCVTRPSSRSAEGRLCFKLNTIDRDFAEATEWALAHVTGKKCSISTHPVKRSKRPNHSLYCGCDEFCHFLVELTENKQVIPQLIWEMPKAGKLAFIEGLMDSEGFVGANKNPTNRRYYMGFKSTDSWVGEFRQMLESVGIRTGKFSTEKPRKPGYKTPKRFHIKMQSWIDSGARFHIARKQDRVDEWASSGPYERRSRYPRLTPEAICPTPQGDEMVRSPSRGGEVGGTETTHPVP